MPDRPRLPLHKHIDYTYEEQGGWEHAKTIFERHDLNYEEKMQLVHDTFGVAPTQARRWYTHYRRIEGL